MIFDQKNTTGGSTQTGTLAGPDVKRFGRQTSVFVALIVSKRGRNNELILLEYLRSQLQLRTKIISRCLDSHRGLSGNQEDLDLVLTRYLFQRPSHSISVRHIGIAWLLILLGCRHGSD